MSRRAEVETRIQVGLRRLVANSVLTNERIAKQVGLHAQDLQALNVISLSEEPMSPGDVSAATGLPPSTTTRVVDRLEQAGYLRRVASPHDRRKVTLEADPAKMRDLRGQYTTINHNLDTHSAQFTLAELETVARYLEQLAPSAGELEAPAR
ncbi:MarR family winged helix-turn-helix transcriptional regulator [Nocardia sp. 2YAB30]|uniref:MarR family winged helix-turn-helix transcriptional regulator n=1 Tax=unclassified Nocardia TaxID=2637762 RepID=UPI003F9AE0C5